VPEVFSENSCPPVAGNGKLKHRQGNEKGGRSAALLISLSLVVGYLRKARDSPDFSVHRARKGEIAIYEG
jgi:hypothetical protein